MTSRFFVYSAIAFSAFGLACASAQEIRHDMFQVRVSPPPNTNLGNTFEFISAEAGIPGQVVKSAPYSATAVTETVQTLADGNRITHKSSAVIARDSAGRTRREQNLPAIGPWAASDGASPKLVTINDPASGTTYILDDHTKTARKLVTKTVAFGAGVGVGTGSGTGAGTVTVSGANQGMAIQHEVRIVPGGPGMAAPAADNVFCMRHTGPAGPAHSGTEPKVEQLGQKEIEGVVAEGTRTTITIPAGAEGNERPIEILDERWYSPELKTTVQSLHSDPRMGETTFKLSSVSRAEPSPSLFDVPSDYKTVEPDQLEYKKMKEAEMLKHQE